jgi:hypothetical protein
MFVGSVSLAYGLSYYNDYHVNMPSDHTKAEPNY